MGGDARKKPISLPVQLQGADFSGAAMHRACLRGVLAAGNLWQQARLVEAEFASSLNELTDLGRADFTANLRQASGCGAVLYAANFSRAVLRGADLREVYLRDFNLQGAPLEGRLSMVPSCRRNDSAS